MINPRISGHHSYLLYWGLFESHKYCGQDLFIMIVYNANIPDVYSEGPQTQCSQRDRWYSWSESW